MLQHNICHVLCLLYNICQLGLLPKLVLQRKLRISRLQDLLQLRFSLLPLLLFSPLDPPSLPLNLWVFLDHLQ